MRWELDSSVGLEWTRFCRVPVVPNGNWNNVRKWNSVFSRNSKGLFKLDDNDVENRLHSYHCHCLHLKTISLMSSVNTYTTSIVNPFMVRKIVLHVVKCECTLRVKFKIIYSYEDKEAKITLITQHI